MYWVSGSTFESKTFKYSYCPKSTVFYFVVIIKDPFITSSWATLTVTERWTGQLKKEMMAFEHSERTGNSDLADKTWC